MHKKILLSIGITILILGTYITPSIAIDNVKKSTIPIRSGDTLYVGGTGPDNYTKIQDAINFANQGDTVFVYDDSSPYYERLLIFKPINLIGENKNTTIIDGRGRTVIEITWDGVNVSGFTIQNGDSKSHYAGVFINSNDNIISDNVLRLNQFGFNLFFLSLCCFLF